VATGSFWISAAFKPFRLRYIMIDCRSIEITDLNGLVLTLGVAKTDVMFVVCRRMVIGIYRIFCGLSPSYIRVARD
jgi:hypothetical protein